MPTFDLGPQTVALRLTRGDDWTIPFHITVDGTDLNITAYTFTAQARRDPDDTDPAVTFTCTKTDAAGGELELTVADTLTDELAGRYVWDLQADHATVGTRTWVGGLLEVVKDATR